MKTTVQETLARIGAIGERVAEQLGLPFEARPDVDFGCGRHDCCGDPGTDLIFHHKPSGSSLSIMVKLYAGGVSFVADGDPDIEDEPELFPPAHWKVAVLEELGSAIREAFPNESARLFRVADALRPADSIGVGHA